MTPLAADRHAIGAVFIVTSEVRGGETSIRRFSLGRTVLPIVVGLPLAAAALYALMCGTSATACYS